MKNTQLFFNACCLVFVMSLYYSCQICTCKTITCPAFIDEKFDQWFPYTQSQILVFKNQTGNTDSIVISNIYRSKQYEGRTGGGYGCGKGCIADITIYAVQSLNTNVGRLSIGANKYNVTGNSQSLSSNVYISLGNTTFSAGSITDTGFVRGENNQAYYISKFQPNITIGSKSFSNVQILEIDTLTYKPPGAYRLYISRNNGLVAWENFSDKLLWIKE